jgi:hypothetical protein
VNERSKLLRDRMVTARAAVPPASDDELKRRYDKRARAGDPGRGAWGKPGGRPPKAPALPERTYRSEEDEAAAIAAAMDQVERDERARAGRRKALFYRNFVPWAALSAAQQARLIRFSAWDAEDRMAQADQVALELGLDPAIVRELARRLELARTHRRQHFAGRTPAASKRRGGAP